MRKPITVTFRCEECDAEVTTEVRHGQIVYAMGENGMYLVRDENGERVLCKKHHAAWWAEWRKKHPNEVLMA